MKSSARAGQSRVGVRMALRGPGEGYSEVIDRLVIADLWLAITEDGV